MLYILVTCDRTIDFAASVVFIASLSFKFVCSEVVVIFVTNSKGLVVVEVVCHSSGEITSWSSVSVIKGICLTV